MANSHYTSNGCAIYSMPIETLVRGLSCSGLSEVKVLL